MKLTKAEKGRINTRLKETISEKLMETLYEGNLITIFPKIGKYDTKGSEVDKNGIIKTGWDYGIFPTIRMDWSSSYFYDKLHISTGYNGRELRAYQYAFYYKMLDKNVEISRFRPAMSTMKDKYGDITNKTTYLDLVNENKLGLLLKCKWTLNNNITDNLNYKPGFSIHQGQYIEGLFEMPIDFISFVREIKLNQLLGK
jgi:hypothetical protein